MREIVSAEENTAQHHQKEGQQNLSRVRNPKKVFREEETLKGHEEPVPDTPQDEGPLRAVP
jgi:hypothetical protein